MISHLKGTLEDFGENYIILDVNGVGYSLICSTQTIQEVKNQGNNIIKLYTVLNVREDAWTLFGFASEAERFWFNTLNSVQGVGGKVAIAILSALSSDDIYNAFLNGDKQAFTRAGGVGPKLATRILSELKEKVVGKLDIHAGIQTNVVQNDTVSDVISALMNLGYEKTDIVRVISSITIDENPKFDTLLKQVLGKLSGGD